MDTLQGFGLYRSLLELDCFLSNKIMLAFCRASLIECDTYPTSDGDLVTTPKRNSHGGASPCIFVQRNLHLT